MLKLKPDARILIVRLTAIGDVVHAIPTACALREALPGAFLAWIVEGRPGDVLQRHRALDEVIVMERHFWKSLATIRAMRRRLRELRFDATIDIQGLSKSSITAWLSGAPWRVGYDGRDGREVSRWCNNVRVLPKTTHIVDRNLELLQPFGIEHPPRAVRPAGYAPRRGHGRARAGRAATSRSFRAGESRGRLAVETLAPRPLRRGHPTPGPAHGMESLVVWAGDEERAWAEQIVAGSGGHGRLAPPTTLKELVALARRASLFLGSDSAPLHLASAVDTPCIALFGPTPGERNGPYGPQHVVLQTMLPPPTTRNSAAATPRPSTPSPSPKPASPATSSSSKCAQRTQRVGYAHVERHVPQPAQATSLRAMMALAWPCGVTLTVKKLWPGSVGSVTTANGQAGSGVS